MARRPYSTACRFFKDSDVEVQIKWYPVAEPVECLPFPSKINSLDWSSFPELAEGVGEVYGSPRTYNGAKAIPYAHGLTPCEPAEVFADGDTYDPLRPPQKYDEKGFPLCCLNRFVGTGGLLWGGEAIVNVVSGTPIPNACAVAYHWTPAMGDFLDFKLTGLFGWILFDWTPPPFANLSFDSCSDAGASLDIGGTLCPPFFFPSIHLTVGGQTTGPTFGAGGNLIRVNSTLGAGTTGRVRVIP